jgi:hypothetical protein
MPSDKPRVQIRFDPNEWSFLENWAASEFITTPQLCKAIILRAIATKKDNGKEAL